MSEYQRYEFLASDRPLTRAQLTEVNRLSSHIEATSTHALIEYEWGNFKHDPIEALHNYFDGFLYWANWGAPQLAFRFPRGVLPATLLEGYNDLDDFITFTRHADYDILDIHFGEMEGPDEWIEYELGSLMPTREELMDGDLRALYIVWLAACRELGAYDDDEEYDIAVPPVPSAFGALTAAQQALAELLLVPPQLLAAAAQHSAKSRPGASHGDTADVVALIELLPSERRSDYLIRLAHNEPGLSRLFITELRALRPDSTAAAVASGERVAYATLLRESSAIHGQWERERREREEQARQRRMQRIHDHQDEQWQQITRAVERGSGAGYDEAARLLVELRTVAGHFGEMAQFQERYQQQLRSWVTPTLRRPSFVKRLEANNFSLPEP